MAVAWAWARPKTFRVGSPATTSRKCRAMSWRVPTWAEVRSRVVEPTRAMKSGINGTVKPMISAEIQSRETTTTRITTGTTTASTSCGTYRAK